MPQYNKLKDGRYRTRVYLGRNENGKKTYKSLYDRDPKKLRQKETDLRRKLDKGFDVLSIKDTFSDWRDRLKIKKELSLEPSELSLWESRTEVFTDAFGDLPLKDVTQAVIQPVVAELGARNPTTGKPTAKRTLQRYISACASVFEYAIENHAAEYNPCKYVEIPRNAPMSTRRALTDEERQRVEEFQHRAQPAAMLLMYSGLRRGEASALLWSDVDLKHNTISVTKSYDFKECRIKEPKTENSRRIVSIPQKLSDYLAGMKHKSPYVLTSAHNQPMTHTAWNKLWDSYMCDMNVHYGWHDKHSKFDPDGLPMLIEPFTPHCLRHTFATLMYLSGVDVLTCQKQMGHSDIKTTLGIYTHLDRVYQQKNIRQLDNFLGSKNKAGGSKGGSNSP